MAGAMTGIKGTILRSRLSFLDAEFGADVRRRVLAALTPAERSAVTRTLAPDWIPFALDERLQRAIVEVVGGDGAETFERLGAASATANLSSVHAAFLRPGDPHAFLDGTPQIYGLYYDSGRREYRRTGPRAGVLTTHDAGHVSVADCLTVIGWHHRALEMCGADGIAIEHGECRARGDRVCAYTVTWRRP